MWTHAKLYFMDLKCIIFTGTLRVIFFILSKGTQGETAYEHMQFISWKDTL